MGCARDNYIPLKYILLGLPSRSALQPVFAHIQVYLHPHMYNVMSIITNTVTDTLAVGRAAQPRGDGTQTHNPAQTTAQRVEVKNFTPSFEKFSIENAI